MDFLLDRYIIKNKSSYYRLLKEVGTKNSWEEWFMYILVGIEETSNETLILVEKIKELIDKTI